MIGGVVQCPWHGSQFDCNTGAIRAGPAKAAVGIYGVSERQGKIILALNVKS
jgi:nitrite reductase/ring-hydroxylating ferredoxin subunit